MSGVARTWLVDAALSPVFVPDVLVSVAKPSALRRPALVALARDLPWLFPNPPLSGMG
jgi:hypothetical protein